MITHMDNRGFIFILAAVNIIHLLIALSNTWGGSKFCWVCKSASFQYTKQLLDSYCNILETQWSFTLIKVKL